jgi:hypothetical protein
MWTGDHPSKDKDMLYLAVDVIDLWKTLAEKKKKYQKHY